MFAMIAWKNCFIKPGDWGSPWAWRQNILMKVEKGQLRRKGNLQKTQRSGRPARTRVRIGCEEGWKRYSLCAYSWEIFCVRDTFDDIALIHDVAEWALELIRFPFVYCRAYIELIHSGKGQLLVLTMNIFTTDFVLTFSYETEEVETRTRNINLFVFSPRN